MRLPEVNPIQKPLQLLLFDLGYLFTVPRPGKAVLLQSLFPDTKTITVPVKSFEYIPAFVAKQKQIPT